MPNIAIYNNKGGTGKTTLATHLAHALSIAGFQVEYYGLDGQENGPFFLGVAMEDIKYDFYDLIVGNKKHKDVGIQARENLKIIPTPREKSQKVSKHIGAESRPDLFLEKKIFRDNKNVPGLYRIFDCGPDKGPTNDAVLHFVDSIICPVQVEPASVYGITNVYDYLEDMYIEISKLKLIIPTQYDDRTNISKDMLKMIKEAFPEKMITQYIPARTFIPKSQLQGETAFDSEDSKAREVAEIMVKITEEVIKVV